MTLESEAVRTRLSFIIPAYNEEAHIGETIESIRTNVRMRQDVPDSAGFEIIVVDNGSTDRTPAISRELGLTTLVRPGITVGALRNSGAMAAKGEILVFLDADISLTPEWTRALPGLLARFRQQGPFVSGSRVHAHGRRTMMDRAWFASQETEGVERYVNSGHMILPRSLFAAIGGFDETLVSGEDSEFCERARGLGFEILPFKEMKVIHRGTPQTIREFFRRERWHGYGDFQSVRLMLRSKPAILALLNGMAFLAVFPGIFLFSYRALIAYLCFLIVLSAGAAFYRNRGVLDGRLPALVLLYGVYIVARSLSLFDRLRDAKGTRWR
jgi:glycosyltransferase involved in cell wall biosynthesis